MKKIVSLPNLILPAALLVTALACTKTETITTTVQQPAAVFSVFVSDPYNNYQYAGTSTFVDSNFYFRNTSDSGASIGYHWDFGDGSTSTDKNPKHSYARRGSYGVSLVVQKDNKAWDTARQTVAAITGQQVISFGDGVNVMPVAIEETDSHDFVLLGSTGYGTAYYLFAVDSLLKLKSQKAFPANYRLTSMKATTDGNYILTGSLVSNTVSNELIKIKGDGTILWNKILGTGDAYSYAAPAPDGGYVAVGTRPVNNGYVTNYNAVVIKTDGNGNIQWQKVLDAEGMVNNNNAVVEADGIVVSGMKRGLSCSECDSILIAKVNNSGSVVWKTSVLGGLNTFVWWNNSVSKLANGNYAVSNSYTRGIFFFSPTGEFLDRKLASGQVAAVISSGDGNLDVLQTESGNGYHLSVAKMGLDGAVKWSAYPDGRQKVAGGYSCCSDSRPISIQPLRNGGVIVTGYSIVNNLTNYSNHTIILMMELDEAGKQK